MKLFLSLSALSALIFLATFGYPGCHFAWYATAVASPISILSFFAALGCAILSFYFFSEREEELHEAWKFRACAALVTFAVSMSVLGMMPDSNYCSHVWRDAYGAQDSPVSP